MKKVLIIDDSALMRRVISDIINADDKLIVEQTASNGQEALRKLPTTGKKHWIFCFRDFVLI